MRVNSSPLAVPVGERDHVQGTADALVTLVEYGDDECPYTGRALPIVKELQRPPSDQLRFVFRNFPLTEIHPHAEQAAEAAEAADAQGKLWEMFDLLFERQSALDTSHPIDDAAQLGLGAERLGRDLAGHTRLARVRDDLMSGARSGVEGTPAFFINRRRYVGRVDLESFILAMRAAAR